MPKLHVVTLTDEERRTLLDLTKKGTAPARRIARARALLLAADGLPDRRVAEGAGCCVATVENLRRRFAAEGLEAALGERPRPGAAPKLDGKGEAYLVATACSAAPAGRAAWTMRLLADELVEVGLVEAISDETVRRVLKKTTSSPGRSASGVSPR
jgi:transposase